ncbi:helix-turn-helix domain-containing protein [Streptomyces formicae]|uniref:Transcriptional regulator, ArsR family n=1 Tax=Streptomyces formicae TaxID=1616117 RepID=A0A291Q1A0_9ACTN|nr:helix-turn-helix domain-containing protein [Streptomyces formicae]ATL25499.1 Transcriptional regulator, ArsR family [Streptomyces formicae]
MRTNGGAPHGGQDDGHTPQDTEVTLDASSLRGLAHPLRVKFLDLLRTEGPATVTRLADRTGVSSASASYHVRQLAQYGFVEEQTRSGGGRERWWKAVHRTTRVRPADLVGSDEVGALADTYLRGVTALYAEQTQRAIDELPQLPAEWRAASTTSDFELRLSADRLKSLVEEIFRTVERYRAEGSRPADDAEETAPVTLQIQAFPRPGTLTGSEPHEPE